MSHDLCKNRAKQTILLKILFKKNNKLFSHYWKLDL